MSTSDQTCGSGPDTGEQHSGPDQMENENKQIKDVSDKSLDDNNAGSTEEMDVSDRKDDNELKRRKIDDGEPQVIPGNRYFILHSGKTLNSYETVLHRLNKQAPGLQEVDSEQECDFILVFCPVVSRAGTDIEAALNKLNQISETKFAVLVVLHHTFNPDQVVPDSRRAVSRKNTITADFLFHEDQGLLQCPQNVESLTSIIKYIKPQETEQSWFSRQFRSLYRSGSASEEKEPEIKLNPKTDSQEETNLQEIKKSESTIKDLEKVKEEILRKNKDVPETSFPQVSGPAYTKLNLLLLGKAGPEMTTAKNIILSGKQMNQAGKSTSTQQNEIIQGEVDGSKISVVETDLFHSEHQVHLPASGPCAFILVIPSKHYVEMEERAEEENQKIIRTMEKLFGATCWDNTMILFTVTDELRKKSSEEFIHLHVQSVKSLVEKCGNKCHCLNIKETLDVSEVKELLEKIEKMVEGNADSGKIFKMLTDTKENREKVEAVRQEMQKTVKTLDEFIKNFKGDLTRLDGQTKPTIKEWIEKEICICELKKFIGEHLKSMYDKVAGMEEDYILPQTQQTLWLSVQNENHKQMNKDEELAKIYNIFLSKVSLKSSSDKQEKENMTDEFEWVFLDRL